VSKLLGNNPDRRERLEQQSNPVAILHGGMYVYANPAYLELLGYRNFSDIEGIPILDMVKHEDQEFLSTHIKAATGTSIKADSLPSVQLSLIRKDNSLLSVIATSHEFILDNEPCIEIWLHSGQNPTSDSTQLAIAKPWRYYLSLAFLALFGLLPLALLPGLNINNDPNVYFPDDEPAVILDKKLRAHFPNDQVYILLFEGDSLFSDKQLAAYHQLTRQLANNPLVNKVFGLTTQDHIAGSEDGFLVEPVINIKKLEETTPAERQRSAIADRFARNALVSLDGSTISLVVVPVNLENSLQRMQLEKEVLSAVQDLHLDNYLSARTGFIPDKNPRQAGPS
jgi:hypothetical protein